MGKRTISRRQFLEGTGTVLTVAAAAPVLRAQRSAPAPAPRTAIRITLNGTHTVPLQHTHAIQAVRSGSKGEILAASKCSPLLPRYAVCAA